MCPDCCDKKLSVKAAMFYFHTRNLIVKFYTNEESLMSYFFYMWEFL